VPPREPVPFGPPDPTTRWSAPPGRTATTLQRIPGGFSYRVAGQPVTIRGMGYNPPAGDQSIEQRRARLERDLTLMAASGVNTLIGWNPAVVEGLALDVAHRAGIGVALPFDVDFTQDVRQPAVRAALTSAVLAWVDQYREHPALRIWALGNEVLQRSVPPAWCSTSPTDEQASWSSAWSGLLVEIAEAIHARDPDHPVLYREAEDAYAPWLARALAERPADRPWLIYGVNAYTPRLNEILEQWPARGIETSLFVSEFAPLDAPRGERADRFREIWGVIRSAPAYVLGGAVYVWSTDGPEEVDRRFGLVDEQAVPVDDTLDAIAALYHGDAEQARRPIVARVGA
jgi:beta-galactosidase/beta-glucuronidase